MTEEKKAKYFSPQILIVEDRAGIPSLTTFSFFKDGPFAASFSFILIFSIVQLVGKILPILGFEPQISGVGSDCSTNWAKTTVRLSVFFWT